MAIILNLNYINAYMSTINIAIHMAIWHIKYNKDYLKAYVSKNPCRNKYTIQYVELLYLPRGKMEA